MKKLTKNALIEQSSSKKTIGVMILVGFFMLILAGNVDAASLLTEFDNIKNYDEETKTYDIRNSILGIPFLQLSRIAEVQLLSEEDIVIYNYDSPVMILGIYNHKDYSGFWKDMDSYLNDEKGNEINVKYRYKYFDENIGTHGEWRTGYETYLNNKSQYEVPYLEQVPGSWIEFNEKENLPEGYVKIAVYLDSQIPHNQKIELIPTLFGEKLNAWTTYQLAEYYIEQGNLKQRIFDGQYLAQTFTPQSEMTIGIISLNATGLNDEGTLYGYVVNTSDGTSSGSPNGTILAIFNNITEGTWDETYIYRNLTFSDNNLSVCANCSYSLVLKGTGDGVPADQYQVVQAQFGNYTYGSFWFDGDGEGVDLWVNQDTRDMNFMTWNFTAIPPPTATIVHPQPIIYNFTRLTELDYINNSEVVWCWISTDGGVSNSTPVRCSLTNFTGLTTNLGSNTWNLWTNSSLGSITGDSVTFTYQEFTEIATYWNSTSFETESETIVVGITTNGSVPGSSELIYNGTTYSGVTATSIGGNNYNISRTIDVPTGAGNKTFNFNFTLGGAEFSTSTKDQDIELLNFSYCFDAPANAPRINITFKNETIGEEWVDASFNSDWYYWAGSGTELKQLTYLDVTENSNYTFCLPMAGSRDLDVNLSVDYSNSISQQRQYSNSFSLGNSTTSLILFLLPTTEGIFMTIQVINVAEQILEDVRVNVTRNGDLIESGTTDGAGLVNFFLNPNYAYTFTFDADGYDIYTVTITPQAQFTVTLGTEAAEEIQDLTRGITTSVTPRDVVLAPNTFQAFNFTIVSTYWTLQQYGFNLTASNGTIMNTTRENANGGTVFVYHNVSNLTQISMGYYWIIDGNTTTVIRTWVIFNETGTGFSVANFFTDLNTYISDGIFGITSNSLTIIIYIVIFLTIGVMSYRFGITSPVAITSMLFLIVFFFEVQLNLIPPPPGSPANTPFATIFMAVILIAMLIRESSK